jgi:hypothetical protein
MVRVTAFLIRRLAVVLGSLALFSSGVAHADTQPDTVPPTKPATPTANPIGTNYATINTGGSTDNDRVAGYVVQRQVNGVWTDWSSTLLEPTYAYVQPLTPGTTYTAVVVAVDPSGNRSPRSDPVTFITTAKPAPTCAVTRQTISPQNFILTFSVENMTAAVVITNWTATFTMPAAQTVFNTIGDRLSRDGDAATLRPADNAAPIGPGMTAFFGFYASRPANSPLPSGFSFTSAASGPLTCTVTDRTG